MITLWMAWINVKYGAGYKSIFIGTVLIDIALITVIGDIFL